MTNGKVENMDKDALNLLEERIMQTLAKKKVPVFDFGGKRVKLGIISDTQLGNVMDHKELLVPYYNMFKREGVEMVLHAGDVVDGDHVYRGQEYDLYAHGFKKQVENACRVIPDTIDTWFITGNHDLSFWKLAGADPGIDIAKQRNDLHYLGQEEADIKINNIIVRLSHPGKGTAYALSYQAQKYIESLSGGEKPNLLIIGHYHKAEYIPNYRNIFCIQAGTIQGQTPFMRRNNISAHMGAWIVDFVTDRKGIAQMRAEFTPYYGK